MSVFVFGRLKFFYGKLLRTYKQIKCIGRFLFVNNIHWKMFKLLVFNYLKLPLQRGFSSCASQKIGKHRYHKDVENGINEQIVSELNAGYTYLSMAAYFGRTDIALSGCHAFFLKMYEEEQEHAFKLIDYQNMRGGHVELCSVAVQGEDQDWKGVCNALSVSLGLEKSVKEQLEKLFAMAEQHKDVTTADFMSSMFITEQDRSICEIARLLTRATKMVENGMGEYLFDRSLYDAYVLKDKQGCKPYGVSGTYK